MSILSAAIGVGLAVSLLFSELFGLAAGGMVVPGYFALFLNRPVNILLTLAAALITYFIVHLLSTLVIIYGKRRTVLMILIGYLVRMLIATIPLDMLYRIDVVAEAEVELEVIGYIIPGLIAIWLDRQGLVETLCALTAASVIIRLVLILIFGMELQL